MPAKDKNDKERNKKNKNKKKVSNKKVNEKEKTSTSKVPAFGDPTKTLWGKIVIWILIFGMGALIIVALIVTIITAS